MMANRMPGLEKRFKCGLVEHGDAEGFRFGELGSGFFSGEEVICFFADRA